MAKALQLASALSEKSNQVSLTVPEKERELVLSVKNAEVGEGVSRIQASVNGKPFEASFNARYLSDCLGAINESSITLSFAGAGKPLLISGAGSAGFRYIVMPMNR
jgi:DNA polymerase-3 subunit beta